MAIETLGDIIEQLADEIGIYGAHGDAHPDGQCECRCCWTSDLTDRIRAAMQSETDTRTGAACREMLREMVQDIPRDELAKAGIV